MSAQVQALSTPGQAFRRGFWNPTPLALATGLVLVVLGLGGLQAFVTSGRFTMIPEARFLRTPHDDWGHVSYVVGQLRRKPPHHAMVYILGGSNARECIPSNASLAQALNHATGVAVDVRDLGSMNQTFGESMAIVDNVPRTTGIVVIVVNQSRFAYTPYENEQEIGGRELLMKSPALNAFAKSKGRGARVQTILPGITSYISSYLQKNETDLLTGHIPYNRYVVHKYAETRIAPRALKATMVQRWLTKQGRPGGVFDTSVGYNGDLLSATVALARSRGFQVVLLEAPENRQVVGSQFDRYKRVYQPLCRQIAHTQGATYVDFVDDIGLIDGDFYDITHLVESGRLKWQGALVKTLAPILRTSVGSPSTP